MGADAAAEEQFGPYLVYERLGVGGMATVHRALERGIEGFERVVALKRLLPHLAADASFIKSFVREAKLASFLNHVNIVQLFELGRVGAAYFISMEYIDGRDIRRILRHARRVSGPPPIHVTVGLLLQLCDALDYAHHKVDDSGHPLGLVHRDVSPSNVLVTTTGQVKVIDFGIAKAQSAQLRTQTGRVKGKLAYMAPEALAGKELDARSDLFAVGVIAHELLTACPLFATKNEYQTLMKVSRGEVLPPSSQNPRCPPELDAIVLRALARDPDDRFADAAAVRDALHALRKQYQLQTSERDIITWLDWAFSLEAPAAGGAVPGRDPSGAIDARPARPRTGRPRRSEDDDAVDVAWGDGEEVNNGQPILLDDVPDVSDKHLATASSLGAEVRLDLDDLADDVPTPIPSYASRAAGDPAFRASGSQPRSALREPRATPARTSQAVPVAVPAARERSHAAAAVPPTASHAIPAAVPAARETSRAIRTPGPGYAATASHAIPTTVPAARERSQAMTAARGPQTSVAAASAVVGASVPSVVMPPRVRTITSAPRIASASIAPPNAAASTASPATALGSTVIPRDIGATLAPREAAPAERPEDDAAATWPDPRRASTPRRAVGTATPTPLRGVAAAWSAPRNPPSSPTPQDRLAAIPGIGGRPPRPETATVESDPAFPSSEVTPRPEASATERTPFFHIEELTGPSDTIPANPSIGDAPPIVRFYEPATASPPSEPAPASLPAAGVLRREVPPSADSFTQLDADEPELLPGPPPGPIPPTAPPAPITSSVLMVPPTAPPVVAAPDRRRIALLIAALAITAVAAAVVVRWLAAAPSPAAQPPHPALTPPPQSPAPRATVQFVLVPADAAITIEGKPAHTGSPWSIELAPGVHQIEIHRDGYKASLMSLEVVAGETRPVRVMLEPLGAAVESDATLTLRSTPPALEAVLDGVPLAARTPITLPLKPGSHTVALRRNGVEVWRSELDARANTMYELAPAIPAALPPAAEPTPSAAVPSTQHPDTTTAAPDPAPGIPPAADGASGAAPVLPTTSGQGAAEPAPTAGSAHPSPPSSK